MCAELIEEYVEFDLLTEILSVFEGECFSFIGLFDDNCKQFAKKVDAEIGINFSKDIVSCFIRKYEKSSKNIIPESLSKIIVKFGTVEFEFNVNYLQMQLNVNDLIFINRNKQCNWCQAIRNNMQRCSGCKYVYYCNHICQRYEWPQHKLICKQIRKWVY
eukprot:341389_1